MVTPDPRQPSRWIASGRVPEGSKVRQRRRACGLTQADLAARAGVSRQLVAAVEGSRQTPAVDAAIGLARALGTTVEELFTPPLRRSGLALGGSAPEGTPLRVGLVGERIVAATLPDRGISGASWARPDAVIDGGDVRLLAGAIPAGLVLAGCDPALGVAETMLAGLGPQSLLVISAPTGRALAALADGRVHAAVVHGRPDDLPDPPVKVAMWQVARWNVGLAVTPNRQAGTLEEILLSSRPIVRREPTASSQQALERAQAAAGVTRRPRGPEASGHLDAARRARTVGTGVTIEAAARAFELDFLPLEEHTVQLWVDERWLSHPGLAGLGEVLRSAAFTSRIALFGGYDLSGCGDRVGAA